MFKREVVKPSSSMIGQLIVGATVVGVLAAFVAEERMSKMFGESKYDVARQTVDDIAARGLDPWGNAYRIYPGQNGVVVQSFGEDGTPNTADDLWSNQ